MKRAALITFTLFLLAIVYSSCKDDVYMDWKLQNDRWYATLEDSLRNDPLFHKTSSGLYYKVIHQGSLRHPDINSYVIVNYTGSLIDGSIFDTQTSAGKYISQEAKKGLQEGLHLMQTGGNYILYIPSKLGNDTISTDPKIPPHSVLKYNLELLNSY